MQQRASRPALYIIDISVMWEVRVPSLKYKKQIKRFSELPWQALVRDKEFMFTKKLGAADRSSSSAQNIYRVSQQLDFL